MFTVIAQIINFLILVILLKKFLFNKIVGIIDEREDQIKEQIINAEQKQKEAEKEIKKQKKIREELEGKWDENLAQMKKDLQNKREKLMEETRHSIDKEEKNWKKSIAKQRDAFLNELKQLSCQQVCRISRKVLTDLANERLENKLIESFLQQLKEANGYAGKGFQLSDLNSSKEIEINTAFELHQKEKEIIIDNLQTLLKDEILINFKESADLICGIELRTEGKKISWSIESYLNSLEKSLQEMFDDATIQQGNNREEIKIEGLTEE